MKPFIRFITVVNKKIEYILLVSLSNIGDVVLTFPVLDILRRDFPGAELTVVAGPKAGSLLAGNPAFAFVPYDKRAPLPEKIHLIRALRQKRFDLAVDLRNTLIPYLVGARKKTSFFLRREENRHMRFQHLNRLKTVHPFSSEAALRSALSLPETGRRKDLPGPYVVVAPGAAHHRKRLDAQCFAALCDDIVGRYRREIVFVGDASDGAIAGDVLKLMRYPGRNLCGTPLPESAALIGGADLALVNDSAPMHLASYLGVPVIAFFVCAQSSNPLKYGPWSQQSLTVTPWGTGEASWREEPPAEELSAETIISWCGPFCREVLQ